MLYSPPLKNKDLYAYLLMKFNEQPGANKLFLIVRNNLLDVDELNIVVGSLGEYLMTWVSELDKNI